MVATATPIAPPICWLVLISPEATPASAWLTPVSAPIVIGTNASASPMPPREERREEIPEVVPSHRQPRVEEERGADKQQAGRQHDADPKRVASACATFAKAMSVSVGGDVGDSGLERRVAEHLLHVQREQEELREQRAAHEQAGDVEPVSVRRRNIRIGRSGAFERSSTTTNAAISAAEAASRVIVSRCPSRAAAARVIAYTSSIRPPVIDAAPGDVEVPVASARTALLQEPRRQREHEQRRPAR